MPRWCEVCRLMAMRKYRLVVRYLDLLDEVRELTEALVRHESKGAA